jgi:hypothetical protein
MIFTHHAEDHFGEDLASLETRFFTETKENDWISFIKVWIG